jgi:pyruvate dehydrogenase E2 component (dihydrolipoamide acetyltransferase)
MNEIVMPKLSDTMTEGRVVSWKKHAGDQVQRGDVIAEVETDKANMELEAFTSGVLLEIKVPAGEMAPVGTVIATIGKPEEKGSGQAGPEAARKEEPPAHPVGEGAEQGQPQPPPEQAKPQPAGQSGEQQPPPPKEPKLPEEGALPPQAAPSGEAVTGPVEPWEMPQPPEEQRPAAETAISPQEGSKEAPAAPAPQPTGPGQAPPGGGEAPGEGAESRERAAPVVRRRARELGIDLGRVKGTGPDGRILLQDLESPKGAPAGAQQPPQPKPPQQQQPPQQPPQQQQPAEKRAPAGQTKPLSRLRAAIAKMVTESWKTIPHFTVTMDIFMDEAESIRQQLKLSGVQVSINAMIVKAVALTLQKFPQQHATFTPEGMQLHEEINIGVAVGVPDGVVIPVITGCQKLSLIEIAQAGRSLSEKARIGALTEQEMSGGHFSVSNLGMFGVSQFTAIIYPSHAGVLAVGSVVDTAVIRAGMSATAKVMKVTLSADHRVVDGVYGAQFLAEFKQILENPVRLLI